MPQLKRDLVLSPVDMAAIYTNVGIFTDDTYERALEDIAHARGLDRLELERSINWQDNYAVNALFNAGFSKPQLDVLTTTANVIYVSGGVRGGKSYISAVRLFQHLMRDLACGYLKPGALYWLVGDKYLNTEAEYGYLIDWLGALGLIKSYRERFDPGEIVLSVCAVQTCAQRLQGTATCRHKPIKIITKSAQDEESLASTAPYGILGCEGSQLTGTAYEALEERALENNALLIVSGTLDAGQSGWFWEMFNRNEKNPDADPTATAIRIPTYSNKVIFPEGLRDPRIQRMKTILTPSTWKSRIEGRPVPLPDLVFGKDFSEKYPHRRRNLRLIQTKRSGLPLTLGGLQRMRC